MTQHHRFILGNSALHHVKECIRSFRLHQNELLRHGCLANSVWQEERVVSIPAVVPNAHTSPAFPNTRNLFLGSVPFPLTFIASQQTSAKLSSTQRHVSSSSQEALAKVKQMACARMACGLS